MRVVHSPSIPQKGIRTVKKLVTRNIGLVRIWKCFWKYQNPSVDVMEHTAWVIPRYVNCRNENEISLFWMMFTRDPRILLGEHYLKKSRLTGRIKPVS